MTTRIANIGDFGEFTRIADNPAEFVDAIEGCLDNSPVTANRERLRCLLERNSWPERAGRMVDLMDAEFRRLAGGEPSVGSPTSGMDGRVGRPEVAGQDSRIAEQGNEHGLVRCREQET